MAAHFALTNAKGRTLNVVEFAAGGDGFLCKTDADSGSAFKVYRDAARLDQAKLAAMMRRPPLVELPVHSAPSVAWPRELILIDGAPVGFAMPFVGSKRFLESYIRAADRELYHIDDLACWRAARSLAGVVSNIHAVGAVIGDLNGKGFLVSERDAYVSSIGTDAFQIIDGNQAYPCPVKEPAHRAPELPRNLDGYLRSTHEDCFALAVLIFMLTRRGVHPFDGVPDDPAAVQDLNVRIKNGWFPHPYPFRKYTGSAYLKPLPDALALEGLPPPIQDLMFRCFVDGHRDPEKRPSANEWYQELQQIITATETP